MLHNDVEEISIYWGILNRAYQPCEMFWLEG
jgi:hypothetical protein